MADLDVRRSWPGGAVGCLRDLLRRGALASVSPCRPNESCTAPESLVSVERIAFPRTAPFTRAFRFVVEYKLTHGETLVRTVRVTTFLVILRKGRTELFLNAFGGHGTVSQSSVAQLARILVGRVEA